MKLILIILLGIELLIFLVTFLRLWKVDRYCSVFYFLLFYFQFALLAKYTLAPQEITRSSVYIYDLFTMSYDGWMEFYFYMLFSLLLFWLIVYRGMKKMSVLGSIRISPKYTVERKKTSNTITVFLLVFAAIEVYLFVNNYSLFSYWNNNNLEIRRQNIGMELCISMVSISGSFICMLVSLILYAPTKYRVAKLIVPTGVLLVIYIWFSFKTADRSGIFVILLGIGVIMLYRRSAKSLLKAGAVLFVLYVIMQSIIYSIRNIGASSESQWIELFFPSGIYANVISAFAVMRLKYIDPIEVIIATIAKSFPLTRHPYLYMTVSSLFSRITVDGVSGFGYFLLSDGYIAMGYMGFLYNGFVCGGLLLFWRKLANTNDKEFNFVLLALMSSVLMSLVRGAGNCYFIKYIITVFIPCMFVYLKLSGKKLYLVRRSAIHYVR